jgi:hypothetical protein
MRWTRKVARMRKKRYACRIFMESENKIDHSEKLEVGERMILKWVLN